MTKSGITPILLEEAKTNRLHAWERYRKLKGCSPPNEKARITQEVMHWDTIYHELWRLQLEQS